MPLAGPDRFRSWGALLCLVVPINLIMAIDKNSFALAAPQIGTALGLSYAEISQAIAAVMWSYAIMQVPSGWLVQSFGPRRVLGVACLLWSLTLLGMPLASGLAGLVALRLLLGLFQAPDWTASIVSVRDWFAPQTRSRANAVLLGCLYLGSTVSGPLTTEITHAVGWRLCFFIFGAVGLVLTLFWLLFFRDGPFRSENGAPPAKPAKGALKALFRMPCFWAIGGYYFCMLSVQSFYHANLPHYLMDARHLSYREMGWAFSLPWFCLYGAVLLSGVLSDLLLSRTGSAFVARVLFGAAGAVLGAVCLEASTLSGSTALALGFLCVGLAAQGACQVSIWSLAQGLTQRHAGLVVGWVGFCGNVAAGIIPVVTAEILRHGAGWSTALAVPSLLGLGAAVCCLLVGVLPSPARTHPHL